jgi:hypothetical protein
MNKAWYSSNPTLALDSWITLGLATRAHSGITKVLDPDSSFIGGNFNSGGSAGIPGGLLVNDDTAAGIPITVADGHIPLVQTTGQWVDVGFRDFSQTDTSIFGSVNQGTIFTTNSAYLQQNAGISGETPDNLVLVAQLTTKGNLTFEINLVVIDSLGNEISFVARNPSGDEVISPHLTYPLPCGCRDTRYLEFGNSYGCDHPDSCRTLIVFGCTDTMACNYDPLANFNIEAICCYPGNCGDRDLGVVCPQLTKLNEPSQADIILFPNPADGQIEIRHKDGIWLSGEFFIYDMMGRKCAGISSPENVAWQTVRFDISELPSGMYLLTIQNNGRLIHKKFLKQQ